MAHTLEICDRVWAVLNVSLRLSNEWVVESDCVFLCVHFGGGYTVESLQRQSRTGKGLSTEAIKQCVCWNNVFDLAAGPQQVLGGPAWTCYSFPALICSPGTSFPLLVSLPFLSSFCVFVPPPYFHFSDSCHGCHLPYFGVLLLLYQLFLCLEFSFPNFPHNSFCSILFSILSLFFWLLFPLSPYMLTVKELSCTLATQLLDIVDTTGSWAMSKC